MIWYHVTSKTEFRPVLVPCHTGVMWDLGIPISHRKFGNILQISSENSLLNLSIVCGTRSQISRHTGLYLFLLILMKNPSEKISLLCDHASETRLRHLLVHLEKETLCSLLSISDKTTKHLKRRTRICVEKDECSRQCPNITCFYLLWLTCNTWKWNVLVPNLWSWGKTMRWFLIFHLTFWRSFIVFLCEYVPYSRLGIQTRFVSSSVPVHLSMWMVSVYRDRQQFIERRQWKHTDPGRNQYEFCATQQTHRQTLYGWLVDATSP